MISELLIRFKSIDIGDQLNERKRVIGFNLIRINLILRLVLLIISSIYVVLYHTLDIDQLMNLYKWDGFRFIITFIIGILSYVLLGTGIYLILNDSRSENHKKDVKLAFIFFWIIIGLSLIGIVGNFLPTPADISGFYRSVIIRSIIFQPINLVSSFLLLLALILPVWRISTKRTRDLLFIYFILFLIGFPIYDLIFLPFYFFNIEISKRFLVMIITLLPNILLLISGIIMIIVYSKTIYIEKTEIRKEEKQIIKGKLLFRKRFPALIRKPLPAVIVFIIIGLLIGSAMGLHTYRMNSDLFEDGGSDEKSILIQREMNMEKTMISDNVAESEKNVHEIELRIRVVSIVVELIWEDEPSPRLTRNEPDTFTLTTSFDEGLNMNTEEKEGTNQQDGEGYLDINYSYDPNSGEYLNEFYISVELTYAGDILGPAGFLVRSQDTNNDYDLIIEVVFIEELYND